MRGCRNWITALALLGALGCRQGKEPTSEAGVAGPEPTPVLRWHFGGMRAPSGEAARRAWVLLSETTELTRLRAQTLDKLARAPFRAWPRAAAATTNDFAPAFREMWSDLAAAESFFEAHGDTNRFSELVLAVRLPPERADFWRTNLLEALTAWSGRRAADLGGDRGWQLSLTNPPGLLCLARAADWTLIGWAADKPARLEQLRARLVRGEPSAARPTNAWLELFAEPGRWPASVRARGLSALGAWLPPGSLTPERLPVVRLALHPRRETMRLEGELIFPDAIAARLDEWQIPTELVRDPIIGFTAVRGVAGLLAQGFAALGLPADSAPNQLFVWVGAAFPVQILAAAPTPAAEKVLQSAAAVLPARFNAALRAADAGALELLTNAAGEVALRWTDIPPFITPFLTVAAGSNQTHLVAGLYPNWAVPDSPAPTALFEHLARGTNLVFYDWEFTGPRSYAWRAGWNVPRHILHKPRLSADTASIAFLNSLTNHPGNTVTEVRLTDTNRLTLVREGPFAFAAAELVWLAHWLESPDFPFRLSFPPAPATETEP
jgi:hypothetical protein